jgi:hypothetical protein
MGAIGPSTYRGHHDGARHCATAFTSSGGPHEMNGTTRVQVRSVQLAVMAAPSASVAEAVAEARRRHDASDAWISLPVGRTTLRMQAAAG